MGHQHQDIAQPRCTKLVKAPTSEGGGEKAGRGVRREDGSVGVFEEAALESNFQPLLVEVQHLPHLLLLELLLPLPLPDHSVHWAHKVALRPTVLDMKFVKIKITSTTLCECACGTFHVSF